MIAEGQKFVGKRIQLDGASFKNCVFEHCQLHFSGVFGIEISGCTFGEGCTWHIGGGASEGLKFLGILYRGGATALVEATFDNLRGNPTPGGPTIQ